MKFNKVKFNGWFWPLVEIGVYPARKVEGQGWHTWACFRFVRVGCWQWSWLSFSASETYYRWCNEQQALTQEEFNYGVTKNNWSI